MISHRHDRDVDPLQGEALDWAVHLVVGPVSAGDLRDLATWRGRSPAHEDAFQRAEGFCGELRSLPFAAAASPGVTALRPPARVDRRAFLGGGMAIAASVAGAAVAVRPPLGLWPSIGELMADQRTGASERHSFAPIDGVEVELNSRSSVSVASRGVRLIAGEIYLAVAENLALFRVETGDGGIVAGVGSFAVRSDNSGLCVTCVAGRVATRVSGRAVDLGPGQQLAYAPDGTATRSIVDTARALAWRQGLLIFRGTPLRIAVNEINRYFPGRLVVTAGDKRDNPVTGVFHINQIELAVVQIQQLLDMRATRLPGNVVLLG